MNEDLTIAKYWDYFVTLDEDLSRLSRFVEFTPDNAGTYSTEMVRLLLAAGSEVDVVAKHFCRRTAPSSRPENIDDYRKVLERRCPAMEKAIVWVPGFELIPWDDWFISGRSPDWWRDYNAVKHDRGNNYQKANLKNALASLAGLLVMLLFFYREERITRLPAPRLLSVPNVLASRSLHEGASVLMVEFEPLSREDFLL